MGFASDQGFRCYRYDVEDESPIFDEGGIENEAFRLLEALTEWGERVNGKEVSSICRGRESSCRTLSNRVQFSLLGGRSELHSSLSTLEEFS